MDSAFVLKISSPDGMVGAGDKVPVHGFAAWFDCMFTGHSGLDGPTITLSTAPAVDKPIPGVRIIPLIFILDILGAHTMSAFATELSEGSHEGPLCNVPLCQL